MAKKPKKTPPTRKPKPLADVPAKRKPHAKQRAVVIDDRRNEVAALYAKGYYQAEIARMLGISKFTVNRDLLSIQKEWSETRQDDLQQAKQQELAKLTQVEREAWQAWERSQQDAVTVKRTEAALEVGDSKSDIDTIKTDTTITGQVGDARFLEQVLRVSERRCKILGLDAPAKVQASGEFLTREQLLEEILAAVS